MPAWSRQQLHCLAAALPLHLEPHNLLVLAGESVAMSAASEARPLIGSCAIWPVQEGHRLAPASSIATGSTPAPTPRPAPPALQEMLQRQLSLQQSPKSGKSGSSSSSSSSASSTDEDEAAVQQVEMVLEAYFMHVDNTYNKLQTLTECEGFVAAAGCVEPMTSCAAGTAVAESMPRPQHANVVMGGSATHPEAEIPSFAVVISQCRWPCSAHKATQHGAESFQCCCRH